MIISPHTQEAYQLLHNGILALSRAEQQGLRVDLGYITNKKKQLTKDIAHLEKEFKDTQFFKDWKKTSKSEININSGPQLSKYLYKVLKLKPPKETDTGEGSTGDEALKQLGISELNMIVEMKKLKKLRDTYLSGFERETVDNVIHPVFNLHFAQTFRSSSDSPNFQNLPKRDPKAMEIIRSAIYPRKGHFLMEADFSGVEVRSNACINKDPVLINYIKDPSTDMHRDMAEQLFKLEEFNKAIPGYATLRQAAKNSFVFPQFYGSWYRNCAEGLITTWGQMGKSKWRPGQGIQFKDKHLSDHLLSVGFNTFDKFVDHVKDVEKDFWGNRFQVYAEWKDEWWRMYQKKGYFDIPTGFRCSGLMDKKQACNYPGQGSAFHCLLWSLTQVDKVMRKEKWDTRIVGQIHDSIVFDANPKEEEYVKETVHRILTQELPKAFDWIIVPMEIEIEQAPIDGSWAQKH